MKTDAEIVREMLAAWGDSEVGTPDDVTMQVVLDTARSMDWPRISADYVSRYVEGLLDGFHIARETIVCTKWGMSSGGAEAAINQRCADAKAGVYLKAVRAEGEVK